MNITNLKAWTTKLRDPSLIQVKSTLAEQVEGGVGHCCMGVGCIVADVPVEVVVHEPDGYDENHPAPEPETDYYFGRDGAKDLPPFEFHEWLEIAEGFDFPVEAHDNGIDVKIGWPTDLVDRDGNFYTDEFTCAALNDMIGLTFPMIADVLDAFGCVEYVS